MVAEPVITSIPERKLVGMHVTMSLSDNRTPDLWRRFMPRRSEITNTVNSFLYNLRQYPKSYDFKHIQFNAEFIKWAGMEVSGTDNVPGGMSTFVIPAGLYAMFHYKGSSGDDRIFRYIYGEWLPGSGYEVDNRPHFEILGEKYKNNDPASEEDLWIPIKPAS